MAALPSSNGTRRETDQRTPLNVSDAIVDYGYGVNNVGNAGPISSFNGPPQNPTAVYQHIQEMSAKRISTLDYLRKA